MNLRTTDGIIRVFRVLAIAEAVSWAALLTGMFLKWITKTTELGVQVAGPVHGVLFIGYCLAAVAVWRLKRWPFLVALAAGFSAVLPFATIAFERWAGSRGWLAVTPEGQEAARVHEHAEA